MKTYDDPFKNIKTNPINYCYRDCCKDLIKCECSRRGPAIGKSVLWEWEAWEACPNCTGVGRPPIQLGDLK